MGLISGILALFIFMLMSIVAIEFLWRVKFIGDSGRKKAYTYAVFYIGALAVIMLAPFYINDVLSSTTHTYKTAHDLGNKEWLGFWGSYMGGVVGAVVTVAVFFFTYKQNGEQHKQTRDMLQEQQRLSIQPFISVDLPIPSPALDLSSVALLDIEYADDLSVCYSTGPNALDQLQARYDYREEVIKCEFGCLSGLAGVLYSVGELQHVRFNNAGQGALWDNTLEFRENRFPLAPLLPSESFHLFIHLERWSKEEQYYNFSLVYKDINSRTYKQNFSISRFGAYSMTYSFEAPALLP